MNNDWLKVFDTLMLKPIRRQRYLENFPQGNYEDRINELIWWIKSTIPNPEHLYSFMIANVKNSHKLLVKWIINPMNWEEYFTWILKNPGLMCEYFLVDYLSRNSHEYEKYKSKRFKFIHKKWTPEQDEDLKIDFITTMTTKVNSWKYECINFWVQLTTSKSRAEYSKKRPNWLDWVGNKKWDIFRTSNKIEEGTVDNYPASYIPDSMCLLVINSNINEFINIQNINIFNNAFRSWQSEGFLPWWPTQYLNTLIKKDLANINDWYHFWLELLFTLVPKIITNSRDFKNIEKYNNFDILFDYNSKNKELKMDYFLKDWSFLMSLFFIVNDKLVTKISW